MGRESEERRGLRRGGHLRAVARVIPRRFQADVFQVLRFGCVGTLATGVHYGMALAATLVMGPYLANFLGYAIAVAVSYFGHERFTFRRTAGLVAHGRRLPRFVVTSVSALILSQAVLAATAAIGLTIVYGLAAAALCVPPYTYLLSRFWVFGSSASHGLDT